MSMINLVSEGLPANYPFQSDWEVTPRHLKQLMDEQGDYVLLDVRLPEEYKISHIEPNTFIPMQELAGRLNELHGREDDHIIVICRSGQRSLQVAEFLRQHDFTDVHSLAGGINQWAAAIDTSLPQY